MRPADETSYLQLTWTWELGGSPPAQFISTHYGDDNVPLFAVSGAIVAPQTLEYRVSEPACPGKEGETHSEGSDLSRCFTFSGWCPSVQWVHV